MSPTQLILARVDKARLLLAEAKTAGEAKRIADMAKAAEIFAIKQKSKEAQEYAHAVHIDALRLEGQFLIDQPKNTGAMGNPGGQGAPIVQSTTTNAQIPTLAQQNITGDESSTAQFVAKIAEDKPGEFAAIRSGEKSISQVKREIKKQEFISRLPAMPEGSYRVVYADPPWSYDDKCDDGAIQSGGVEKHYPSMSIEDLCSLPLPDIQPNAVLFFWVTSPLLSECWPIIKAWGFEYKASFIWDKISHNMGHYNSVRHEILLVCTRGSCQPEAARLFDSVQSIRRGKHSEKPEQFRDIIDTIYPTGPKIELFARKRYKGWSSYGNELLHRNDL